MDLNDQATVTVVIASRNRPGLCRRAVDALLDTDVDAVVVIDDRSEPPLADGLNDLADERLQVERAVGVGASAARNQGARAARGALVAFIDDDVLVDQRWLDALRSAARRWPEAAAIGGPVRAESLRTSAQRRFEARVRWGDERGAELMSLAAPAPDRFFPYVPHLYGTGANFCVRAAAFGAVGGFDERLGPGTATAAAEDVDLAVRLICAGGSIGFDPAVVALHSHRSTESEVRAQLHSYGRGLGAWATKLIVQPGRTHVLAAAARGIMRRSGHRRHSHQVWWPGRLAELSGLFTGPFAYVVSAVQSKR